MKWFYFLSFLLLVGCEDSFEDVYKVFKDCHRIERVPCVSRYE